MRRRTPDFVDTLWSPPWVCPSCGRPFANPNQSHSCGRYTVRDHLTGQTKRAIELYRGFAELVRRCGRVAIVPGKNRIGFQARIVFASINKLDDAYLDAEVVLGRRLESARFTRIESSSSRNHVHHFRIRSVDELDDEVTGWLREAYAAAEQEHLTTESQDRRVRPRGRRPSRKRR